MLKEKIILENKVSEDNYTDYVCEKYDIQNREKTMVEIPNIDISELDKFNWNIGVICGNSGSGKSTLLKTIGKIKDPTFIHNKCVCSQFPNLSEQEVCDLLTSVGLSSIPTWLREPFQLSNGEFARLSLAKLLSEANEGEVILIDEFSSTINRHSAISMSYALQRYARKKNLKIIVACCHFDVIEPLKADWVFNLNKQTDGTSEIERLIYSDDKDYELYKDVSDGEVLTAEMILN